jgi:hypothetical protein
MAPTIRRPASSPVAGASSYPLLRGRFRWIFD